MSPRRNFVVAALLLAAAACTDAGDDGPADVATHSQPTDELDPIGLAQSPASLLVLAPSADDAARARLERTLDRVGGGVIEALPPRLVIAQVPAGADAILRDAGVVARFDRAVTAADLGRASLDEQRFADVYSNRWWPAQVPPPAKLVLRRAVRAPGEPFERTPSTIPLQRARFAAIAPDDQIPVPYASGTIVISIVLPESNGVGEPSTEDWSEDQIRATYLKVQAAIDNLAQSEPNSHLRYVVRYESRPGHGGLPGTVDSDLEFGKHATWNDWSDESKAIAALLATILGHPVDANDVWSAALEYDAQLKAQYHADAAYFVIVAADGNGTAGLRAHAYINGPWTVLDSSYGWETFNHEFGHILGAMDEYCPDACTPTTAQQGYLGMTNANATYRVGGDGINDGMGEDLPSLMNYNVPTAINGYTRASWGWLDVDGDGVIDVRDTVPRSTLTVQAVGQTVRAMGVIVDQPAPRFAGQRYSMNRIDALEYRVGDDAGAPWFRVALPADTRGQQAIDVALCELPAGAHAIWIRAINSAGNVEPAQRVALQVDATGNAAPRARLVLDRAIASTAATVTARAIAQDDDAAGGLLYRFDTDGDGVFDTAWSERADVRFAPRAGTSHPAVQVEDAAGAITTATADLDAFDGDAPPAITLAAQPSVLFGAQALPIALTGDALDPEGGVVSYRWLVDDATTNFDRHDATDWSASPALATTLDTPAALAATRLDLTTGDPSLAGAELHQVLALDANTLAVAGGWRGLWILDLTNRAQPQVIAHLDLETTADHLFRDGDRLWVLGSLLTVVDVHDRKAPVELKQLVKARATRTLADANVQALAEGQPAHVDLYDSFGARVSDTRVEVAIDHPQPADLKITLYPPARLGLAPIVLWDHKAAPGGARTLRFNEGNTPALKALEGVFVTDAWSVEVVDDVANGVTGRWVSTKLAFTTSSSAVPVLDNPSRMLVANGRLVVVGSGLETFDATFTRLVMPLSILKGTVAFEATAVGTRVIVAGRMQDKSKSGTPPPPPPLRGLSVVDVSQPLLPIIRQAAIDVGGDPLELARVGSRVYVRVQPGSGCTGKGCGGDPITIVGATAALASCGGGWQLGTTPYRLDPGAFGDDQTAWAIDERGAVARFDVSSPGAIAKVAEYPRSTGMTLVPLAAAEAVLVSWGTDAHLVRLDQITSTVSRVYRLTLEARDAAGQVARAARTVQLVPYDHAPVITSAAVTAGATTSDTWTFHVAVSDPDAGTTWDPQILVRADWDGDGAWDSDWFPALAQTKGGPLALDVYNRFVVPGHYDVVFQVRDGFWASSTYALGVDVR